jgi:hypothetical protein
VGSNPITSTNPNVSYDEDAPRLKRSDQPSVPTSRRARRALVGQSVRMLTRTAIERSDDPVYLIVDELIHLVDARPVEQQVGFVRTLSPAMRMMWGVFMVDGEVNNGGFNQFFWNSSSDYVGEARAGFDLIGAHEQRRLLDEAVARFEQQFERLRPFHERDTIEAFSESYEENLFADLDDRYFDLDTYDLQLAYVRSHLDEFTMGA